MAIQQDDCVLVGFPISVQVFSALNPGMIITIPAGQRFWLDRSEKSILWKGANDLGPMISILVLMKQGNEVNTNIWCGIREWDLRVARASFGAWQGMVVPNDKQAMTAVHLDGYDISLFSSSEGSTGIYFKDDKTKAIGMLLLHPLMYREDLVEGGVRYSAPLEQVKAMLRTRGICF